jgi:hypothetical protein
MADVAPRDWRLKAREIRHEHTKEITRQELPEEVQALLLEMADKINAQAMKLIELERSIEDAKLLGKLNLQDFMQRSA